MMAAWDQEQLLLTDVARFVESDAAVLLAASAREFNVDPAEGVDDPWLAQQLRIGLMAAMRHNEKAQAAEKPSPAKDRMFEDHKARMDNARRAITGR